MSFVRIYLLIAFIQQNWNIEPTIAELITYNSTLNKSDISAVSRDIKNLHVLNLPTKLDGDSAIRLNTTTFEDARWDSKSCPLVFTFTQSKSTRSWALPLEQNLNSGKSFYLYSSEFTLCLQKEYYNIDESSEFSKIEFLVFVSTCSSTLVNYTLEFIHQEGGFVFDSSETISNVEISPVNLHFYRYSFGRSQNVVVKVDSEDEICMVAAVQSPWCHLLNTNSLSKVEAGVETPFNAYSQQMTKLAVIPVSKSDLSNEFFVGFKVLDNDDSCKSYRGMVLDDWTPIEAIRSEAAQRIKRINIQFIPEHSSDGSVVRLLFPLMYVLIILCFTIIVYATFKSLDNGNSNAPTASISSGESTELLVGNDVEQVDANIVESIERTTRFCSMKELISSDTVQKSLDRIYLLIGSIGIFYCIPTIQLLYTYHKISDSTGETDLCYRNYLCSHRLIGWDDFNHMYSNIVYVILAFAFCIFVISYQQKVEKPGASTETRQGLGNGVVHQFGIFYALGVCIGLEGIFSALYHVCPTALHFQYDTSFMLILSILTTIKIYQFRHPDPLCSNSILGLLALISFMNVGGIISNNEKIYELVFIVLHLFLLGFVSVYLYYVGTESEGGERMTDVSLFKKCDILNELRDFCFACKKPKNMERLCLIGPLVTFNVVIDIMQLIGNGSFPTYLIYVFAGNMMIYFIFYFIKKIYHKEVNTKFIQPCIYLILSLALGVLGVLCFVDHKYDTNLSPAESRAMNAPCIVKGFYDTHDLWHFLSAGAIFFFYMALLTLDDGILHKKREEIVGF